MSQRPPRDPHRGRMIGAGGFLFPISVFLNLESSFEKDHIAFFHNYEFPIQLPYGQGWPCASLNRIIGELRSHVNLIS